MTKRIHPYLTAASLLCVVFLTRDAHATDEDKRPLFNTFYLQVDRGAYVLQMSPNRQFVLTAPGGEVVEGTFHASDKEVGLVSGKAARHFRYRFDYQGNVTFEPTDKDHPASGATTPSDALGWMPPQYGHATYVAGQGYYGDPYPDRGRYYDGRYDHGRYDRDRFDRDHGRDRNDGRYRRHDRDRHDRYDRGHHDRDRRVWVPARYERQWVPPVTRAYTQPSGRTVTVTVREGYWHYVYVPGRYEYR